MPSSEKEGIKPGEHYDGVGPLPGSISETSVAKLPDERDEPSDEPDPSVSRRPAAAAAAAATTATTRPAAAGVSLPSQEKMGVQPYEHYDGVGPLPGTSSETSVAKLPDERKAEEQRSARVAVASQSGVTDLGTQVRSVVVDDSESRDARAASESAQRAPEREDEETDVKVRVRFF